MSSDNLYERLGVTKTASSSEIRKAYRSLVLIHHPDKNTSGDGDPAKFQSIQEAYEILSDDASRATYDATGLLPGQKRQQQPGAGAGADFFEQMFGAPGRGPQPFNRSSSAPPQRRKAKSSTTALEVTLEELYLGKTYNFSVKRVSLCKGCKGSGARPGAAQKECYPCQGYGQTRTQAPAAPNVIRSQWTVCQKCKGSGQTYRSADKCTKCSGAQTFDTTKRITIELEPGHSDGSRITVEGAGDEEVGAEKAGDLIFIVAVQPHASFRFVENAGFDLECDATLTLSELLLGFDRIVTVHLDGRHLQVRHRATIEPGSENRVLLRGEGLRKGRKGGNRPSTSRTSSANSKNSTGSGSVKGGAADGEERGDLWIRLKTEQSLSHWLQSLSSDQRKQLESMLPAKRPPLDIEPDQVHVMKDPQVLTDDQYKKFKEEKAKAEADARPSSSSRNNYTRGPRGYEPSPSQSEDLNCKPS